MSSRREEKYLLNYRTYTLVKNRVSLALCPDKHYAGGRYIISSLYFDDLFKTAFYEKEDGLSVHTKFRIRSYNCSDEFLRLEKKTKRGLTTIKESAVISKDEMNTLVKSPFILDGFSEKTNSMAAEMQSKGMRPAVTVRYQREAFYLAGTDVRVTFDTRVESLPSTVSGLFEKEIAGIPAIHPANVIMEIKYSEKLPSLIRRLCSADSSLLSVSKYALCTQNIYLPASE